MDLSIAHCEDIPLIGFSIAFFNHVILIWVKAFNLFSTIE